MLNNVLREPCKARRKELTEKKQKSQAHELYTSLQFDPFPRSPLYPPDVHRELLENLKNWCSRFPGKIYIHENAMKQGFFGIYQYGDNAALRDFLEDLPENHS